MLGLKVTKESSGLDQELLSKIKKVGWSDFSERLKIAPLVVTPCSMYNKSIWALKTDPVHMLLMNLDMETIVICFYY